MESPPFKRKGGLFISSLKTWSFGLGFFTI